VVFSQRPFPDGCQYPRRMRIRSRALGIKATAAYLQPDTHSHRVRCASGLRAVLRSRLSVTGSTRDNLWSGRIRAQGRTRRRTCAARDFRSPAMTQLSAAEVGLPLISIVAALNRAAGPGRTLPRPAAGHPIASSNSSGGRRLHGRHR
jgi:hypothetical protein